jgi:threonine synthase
MPSCSVSSFCTGHGLKDPDTAITQCKDTMININPVMEEVKNAILDNM